MVIHITEWWLGRISCRLSAPCIFLFCRNDAGCCRDEASYKGLDLSKNETDDITSGATQETLTSSTAATSHKNYDDDADKPPKLRRFCFSRSDRVPFNSGPCRRLRLSSSCAGHMVSLRRCGAESGGNDVRVSTPMPHDRVLSSLAGCRPLPTGLPLRLKPCSPPSLIHQSPSSSRGPSTTAATAAAAAFQRRLFLEALRSSPMHSYVDTAACDRNSAVGDVVGAPSANYAAAVLGTQLAIHAWFRTAFDTHSSPPHLRSDYVHSGGQDWIQRPTTSPVPLTPREVERNQSSPCRTTLDDMEDDTCDDTSRPASELSQMEQMVSELDDDQLPSPAQP